MMKSISEDFALTLTYDLEISQLAYNFNFTSLSLTYKDFLVWSKQDKAIGKKFMFFVNLLWLSLLILKLDQRSLHTLTLQALFISKPNMTKGKVCTRMLWNFSPWSSMTLNLDLETSFKVTAHLLSKGTLSVKYKPYKLSNAR